MENSLYVTIGQTLIGFYFVFFGFWNIYHWVPFVEIMTKKRIPLPFLFMSIGITWQVLAGFMIMLGFYVKIAALSLIPFTLISILIFHDFWNFEGALRRLNLNIFIANLTVTLGALLHLINSAASAMPAPISETLLGQ